MKNYPVVQYFSFNLKIEFVPSTSILIRLMSNDEKPIEHRKIKPGYNFNRRKVSKPKRKPFHEKWLCAVSEKILEPIFTVDFAQACELIKEDGEGLNSLILLLEKHINKWKEFKYPADIIGHFYNVLIKDFLVEDPKPTKENPNPKPSPTLFFKSNGSIVNTVPQLKKNKTYQRD